MAQDLESESESLSSLMDNQMLKNTRLCFVRSSSRWQAHKSLSLPLESTLEESLRSLDSQALQMRISTVWLMSTDSSVWSEWFRRGIAWENTWATPGWTKCYVIKPEPVTSRLGRRRQVNFPPLRTMPQRSKKPHNWCILIVSLEIKLKLS